MCVCASSYLEITAVRVYRRGYLKMRSDIFGN